MWRTDRNLLYRVDSRDPRTISRDGFEPWSSYLPVSLANYAVDNGSSVMVSTSRSDYWVNSIYKKPGDHLYVIDAPGGIDMTATMRRGRWAGEQEVVFPGGIRPEFIVEAWFGDGEDAFRWRNPRYQPSGPESGPQSVGEDSVELISRSGGAHATSPLLAVPVPLSSRPRGADSGPDELSPVVHRGEFEVEFRNGEPYVRVYMVSPNRQNLWVVRIDEGLAEADVPDVQQDPGSGRVIVAVGRGDVPMTVTGGRPLAALKLATAMTRYQLSLALPKVHESAPVLRSFLLPLAAYRELSVGAAGEPGWGVDPVAVANIRGELEPNVFAVPKRLLGERLASRAVPGSLITYTDHRRLLPSTGPAAGWDGQVASLDVLRERLGVPGRRLNVGHDPWPTTEQLQDGTVDAVAVARVGAELRMLLVTWWQSRDEGSERRHYALTDGEDLKPYQQRWSALRAFLVAYDIGPDDTAAVDRFMSTVVEPWAAQAGIAETLLTDYTQLADDPTIPDEAPVFNPSVRGA